LRNNIKRFNLVLLFLSFIANDVVSETVTDTTTAELQPCWLENPVTDKHSGQIGIARDLYTGGELPIVKSRKKALQALATQLNIELPSPELTKDTKSINLGPHTIYFTNEYSKEGYVYSYAQLDNKEPLSEQCEVNACALENCSPEWLCQPSTLSEAGVLGVSYIATSPSVQQNKAIENAALTAQYMYGVNINANQHLFISADKTNQFSILNTSQQITAINPLQTSYLVTNSCSVNSSLFVRLKLNITNLEPANTFSASNEWISNPKYKGYDGAVGSVEKRVASGLISDQITLAIKRALVTLALEKESNIKEELLNIEFEKGGTIYVSSTDQNTQVDLKARVAGIHYLPNSDELFKVLVWVIRI